MEVIVTRRERYPIPLERSSLAQKGLKNEQKLLERYTKSGVALPRGQVVNGSTAEFVRTSRITKR